MADSRRLVPVTSNIHVARFEPLVPPRVLLADLPLTRGAAQAVLEGRDEVRDILGGRDRRLLVVVGPCSIHDPAAALEYAGRLVKLRRELADNLAILMRVYFEKPRTTVGWKGLINDPHLDGTRDMGTGLRVARQVLLATNEMGLPAATELLGPVIPQYVADLVAWTAIGARTAESQTHREMASGLSMPVGFKNTTDGNLTVALDGMLAAATPHTFLGMDDDGRGVIVHTSGNPDRHLVLRGGGGRTNYDKASVMQAAALLAERGLPTRVMVDCSHGNSGKDPSRQPAVFRSVVEQAAEPESQVMGVMLESHLHGGSQRLEHGAQGLRYGVSITDPCLDWETTEAVLRDAARVLSRSGYTTPTRTRSATAG